MTIIKFLALASLAFFAAIYLWAYHNWINLKVFAILLGFSPWFVRYCPRRIGLAYLGLLQFYCRLAGGGK